MRTKINSAGAAIDFFGGNTAVAKLFGVSDTAVCNWRWRGLPPDTYSAFRKLFEARGLAMPPASLWRHREIVPTLDAGIPTDDLEEPDNEPLPLERPYDEAGE